MLYTCVCETLVVVDVSAGVSPADVFVDVLL
jgi:hypothetical protein